MERIAIESSNLKEAGYDEDSQQMEIEFKAGGVYIYFDVPQEVFEGLLKAESKGKYFWKYIRDKYEFHKEED